MAEERGVALLKAASLLVMVRLQSEKEEGGVALLKAAALLVVLPEVEEGGVALLKAVALLAVWLLLEMEKWDPALLLLQLQF